MTAPRIQTETATVSDADTVHAAQLPNSQDRNASAAVAVAAAATASATAAAAVAAAAAAAAGTTTTTVQSPTSSPPRELRPNAVQESPAGKGVDEQALLHTNEEDDLPDSSATLGGHNPLGISHPDFFTPTTPFTPSAPSAFTASTAPTAASPAPTDDTWATPVAGGNKAARPTGDRAVDEADGATVAEERRMKAEGATKEQAARATSSSAAASAKASSGASTDTSPGASADASPGGGEESGAKEMARVQEAYPETAGQWAIVVGKCESPPLPLPFSYSALRNILHSCEPASLLILKCSNVLLFS